MPYIDAVILARWVKDAEDTNVPDLVSEIYVWAITNDEYLPEGQSGVGPFGRYQDITGQANVHQQILDDLAIFCAKLEITVPTAQQFQDDPRIFMLGFRRRDDDGTVLDDNWDETLPVADRARAVSYITNNSKITAQQLAEVFDPDDTRAEIAQKLKDFFKG